MSFKGECLCGACCYQISTEPQMVMKCHCRDCQKVSGGEGAAIIGIAKSDFSIDGDVKAFSVKGSSGGQVHRKFCPQCGTHLYSEVDMMKDMIYIKAGTMEPKAVKHLKTAIVFWTDNRNDFTSKDENAQSFARNP